MISELSDEEILDFLMTSDFEGDYKPEELKYLLYKWRNFFRQQHGKYEHLKNDIKLVEKRLEEESIFYLKEKNNLLSQLASKDDEINQLKNRKLTLKERLKGKIINNDEN
jgi:hypothetical protein